MSGFSTAHSVRISKPDLLLLQACALLLLIAKEDWITIYCSGGLKSNISIDMSINRFFRPP